jgi:hypothetical protein
MAAHQVRALLMGGQACVFYGAAEFSRDVDLVILAEPQNLAKLSGALAELQAECIAVPPFQLEHLERGHAVHFRCHHPEARDMRIDVMTKLRGVDPFPALWDRRTTVSEEGGTTYELLGLPDLVTAKKTQRSKDWPMLKRLLEAHYLAHRATPSAAQQEFWLRELRTPELLVEVAALRPDLRQRLQSQRPVLQHAEAGSRPLLEAGLAAEEQQEREQDRLYWQPLKSELERLRHSKDPASQ